MMLLGAILAGVVALAVTAIPAARAGEADEWTFQIKAEELKRQFVYKGSSLNPIVKAVVRYKKTDEGSEPLAYESVWCHDGQPVGVERHGPLAVRRGDIAHVEITQKDFSESENRAVAYVIMRLGIAAYLNSNPIITITVPAASFHSVCSELRNRRCQDYVQKADTSSGHGVLFNLESEPAGLEKRLFYKNDG